MLPPRFLRQVRRLGLVTLGALAAWGCEPAPSGGPFVEPDYDFGQVVQGGDVEHAFTFRNATDRELRIRRVGTTPGTQVVSVDSVVAPGGSGTLRLRVATTARRGEVNELANVYTDDPETPIASLHVRGTVVLPIEVTPRRQAYFFTVKGEAPSQLLTLVSHGDDRLEIRDVTSDNPRFTVRRDGSGNRRALTVALDPATPAGKHEGTITVTTTSSAFPRVTIPAFAHVKDSLSTSVDTIAFGQLALDALKNEVLGLRSVVVTKRGGGNFRVLGATTDLPYLRVDVAPQKEGESFLVNIRFAPNQAKRGRVVGTLRITTNDPSRPELHLPIRGDIV